MPKITIDNFFQSQFQDAPFVAGSSNITHFVGCSPHHQLGLIASPPTMSNQDVNSFSFPGAVTLMVPYSTEKMFVFIGTRLYVYNIFLNTMTFIENISTGLDPSWDPTDAIYFDGYVYFAHGIKMEKLGRIDVSTNVVTKNWATFPLLSSTANIQDSRRPMFILNKQLYIGDEHYVSLVDDAHVFVGDALDIEEQYRVTCLTNINSELLIGTSIKGDSSGILDTHSKIYRWNTWSISFSAEATIDSGLCAYFVQDHGEVFIVATHPEAYVYQYAEPYPRKVSKIPARSDNVFVANNPPTVIPNHTTRYNSRTYFAISGSEYYQGLYSFHSEKPGLPRVLSCEYGMPDGIVNDAPEFQLNTSISAIASYGNSIFAGYTAPTAGRTGMSVSNRSSTSRNGKYLVLTPYMHNERDAMKDVTVKIPYHGAISEAVENVLSIEATVNGSSQYLGTIHDSYNAMFYTENAFAKCGSIRLTITVDQSQGGGDIAIEQIIFEHQ